jgi:hypothetical protein
MWRPGWRSTTTRTRPLHRAARVELSLLAGGARAPLERGAGRDEPRPARLADRGRLEACWGHANANRQYLADADAEGFVLFLVSACLQLIATAGAWALGAVGIVEIGGLAIATIASVVGRQRRGDTRSSTPRVPALVRPPGDGETGGRRHRSRIQVGILRREFEAHPAELEGPFRQGLVRERARPDVHH